MAAEDYREIARRFIEEAWGNGNLTVARELLGPGLINNNTKTGQAEGLEGFISHLGHYHSAFPERRFIHERLVVDGNKVADSWTMIAFHKGTFFGVRPTGKLVTLTGADLYRFDRGKIVEVWHEQDVFGVMMELLGVLP